MEEELTAVPGKRFFVHVAGETKNAHQDVVAKLNDIGLTEVRSPGESDYLLVFCPVTSRVKLDIEAALQQIEGGTPVILVVMHHTFNLNYVLSESRRQVENPNVHLTVDVLFYEGKLLQNCNVNDNALHEVKKFFNVSETQDSWWSKFTLSAFNHQRSPVTGPSFDLLSPVSWFGQRRPQRVEPVQDQNQS